MPVGAIDIGGTKTLVGIVNQHGKILCREKFATDLSSWETQFTLCENKLRDLCKLLGIAVQDLKGVGINLNGMVDTEKGMLLCAPFSSWKEIAVRDWFQARLGTREIYIENDVNASALGELYFGWKDRFRSFVWMTISTGVGGAVVQESKLLRGCAGVSGEVGHFKVEYTTPRKCPCGQMGCLEAHASGTAITRMTGEAAAQNPAFAQSLCQNGLQPDAPGCETRALAGDAVALDIYRQAGVYLGRGIAYIANLLNPQAVILGGGVAKALDLMLPAIRETILENAIAPASHLEVVYTRLGYETALLGAAALVFDHQKHRTSGRLEIAAKQKIAAVN